MKGGRKNSGRKNEPEQWPALSDDWDTERGKANPRAANASRIMLMAHLWRPASERLSKITRAQSGSPHNDYYADIGITVTHWACSIVNIECPRWRRLRVTRA
jgi:hypothetical protein